MTTAREIAWLRRLLVWCRARLKKDGYQELLDRYLAAGPTEPDDTKVVQSTPTFAAGQLPVKPLDGAAATL